ncbi:hypothetical protein Pla110_32970 [Polystyrenella longa]|uniref:Uncharacterized protein n=1 Tax=Polystyrenella longa TaxID=2528007 RepID=A0A518CQR8_9PLAN|nr:hypothetical protein [Polystyrenella longa]QDU81555.1 hypothetical protein Pla110_32970 [Polystyrenella longa]
MSSLSSERIAVVATIDPQGLIDNSNVTSDYVDMSKFHKAMFVVAYSDNDTTVDVDILESVDSAGTSPTTVKSATQSSAANGQIVVNVSDRELSKGYVACKVTVGNGASGSYVTVLGLGDCAKREPASDNDLSTVVEIVS